MPLDEYPTPVSHPRAPYSADLEPVSYVERKGDAEAERPWEEEKVVEDNGERDNDRLRDFGSVDARKDVDAVCAKR